MKDIKACVVCFSTEGKLYHFNDALRTEFNTISGLQSFQSDGMPEYLCWECKAYVKKFNLFRSRCHRAHYVLQQLLIKDKEIRLSRLSSIDRHKLQLLPTLSYLPIVQYVTGENQANNFELHRKIKVECDDQISQETYTGNKSKTRKNTRLRTLGVQTDLTDNPNNPMLTKTGVTFESYHPDLLIPSYETRAEPVPEPQWPQIVVQPFNDATKVETDDFFDAWDTKRDSDTEVFEEMLSYKDDETMDQEYASLVPINSIEARAALEVFKFTSKGDYECSCGIKFKKEEAYNQHLQKHNKFQSGEYRCDICSIYFKTDFLLGCHFKDNHLYKFVCKSCPEVSFTRTSAKQHYIAKHIRSDANIGKFKNSITMPKWSRHKPKFKKAIKPSSQLPRAMKGDKKLPGDCLVYSPISQEEQYELVLQRRTSRNYLEAPFRCHLCYRGYRLASTYNRHMTKHDPKTSGPLQCDMCKLYFQCTRKMYKHMISYHLYKYSCRRCDFVCTSKCIALYHYRWHNNVVYDCPHCDRKFTKISSQLTHIRYKHPSTDLCNMCGHSFISVGGLNCHKQMSHSKEEIELSAELLTNMDTKSQLYCTACNMQFYDDQAFTTHLSSSSKHVDTNFAVNRSEASGRCAERSRGSRGRSAARGRPRRAIVGSSEIVNNGTSTANNCEVCGLFLVNDVVARKHYEAEHPGTNYLKRYMCDVCGHTTKQYANLLVHMRVHTQEKPYACPHCDRKFSLPSNRDRHLVVHTGEKRYQCQHCNRRFTQSTAVKLHIQTVHMKIPYKPWDKKNRKRRKDVQNADTHTDLQSVLAPVTTVAPQHKILLDPQAEYITYIAYPDQ